jgi:hypothetical protein
MKIKHQGYNSTCMYILHQVIYHTRDEIQCKYYFSVQSPGFGVCTKTGIALLGTRLDSAIHWIVIFSTVSCKNA